MKENIDKQLDELEADLARQLADVRRLRASLQSRSIVKEKKKIKKTRLTTIKQEVLEILAKYPDGIMALEILDEMKAHYRPDLLRETLSPQLSRLKNDDNKVIVENKIWRLSN